jgi:prepilin-type N-terminal cleavage/methylation domain-containing protein
MKRQGFTLLELVLVVAIVAVVLTLAAIAIRNSREAANRTQINNNLRHISLSCHSCNDVFRKLPPAFATFGQMQFPASIHVHLVPYIESDTFYKEYLDQKGQGNVKEVILPPFLAPADPTLAGGKGIQNFAANFRVFSSKGLGVKFNADMPALAEIEPGSASIPGTFVHGTSNTILFATKYARCQNGGSRYADAPNSRFAAFFGQNAAKVKANVSDSTATFQLNPYDPDCVISPLMAQSFSSSGISVGLADGSVRFVSPDISPRTWNLVLQPNEKMEPGNDW